MTTLGYPLTIELGFTDASISLGDGERRANMERFRWPVPLLPHLCPLSVP